MRAKLLIVAGTFFVALGILGIFLPVLPTTPLLLLAAACYARSSRRLHDWLLNSKYLGRYIANFRERKGMHVQAKVVTLVLLWATIGYSAFAFVEVLVLRAVLLIIAAGVTIYLLSLPILRE